MSKNKDEFLANDIFGSVDKINEDGVLLSKNPISKVEGFIDTGCLVLNAILSGKLEDGGVPVGRITGFSGPSGTGKTFIINKIIANAQKKGMYAVIWDTESAIDSDTAEGLGVDPTKVKYYPVNTIEKCRNQILRFLDNVIAKGESHKNKYIIAVDSLGNLCSQKELDDAIKDKDAADMGLRAKALKSMMRTLTYKTAKAGVTMLFTNHTYDDPGAMFPKLVKTQAGGKGPIYLSSVLVQLDNKQSKIETETYENSLAHKVDGTILTAMTAKNRFIPPFLKCEMELKFSTGLSKFSGLFDIAQKLGIVETKSAGSKGTIALLSETKEELGSVKQNKENPEFWAKILPPLSKKIQENVAFGSANQTVDDVLIVPDEERENE